MRRPRQTAQRRSLEGPPFPAINALARARATTFNKWEKAILSQMKMNTSVEELIAQPDHHLPIETAPALMKSDSIIEAVCSSFFNIKNIRGVCFIDKDHEEMQFYDSCINNRPEGLEFF
jgi:hypothetical protein